MLIIGIFLLALRLFGAVYTIMSEPITFSLTTNNDIESVAGYLSGEYQCSYSGVNGTLYAGSQALYFWGTYFLFDRKVRLLWEDVQQIRKMDQGLQVVLKKTGATHEFAGIHNPTRVWTLLVTLHNDALLEMPHQTTPRGRMPRRRNSDPSSILVSSTFDTDLVRSDSNEEAPPTKSQDIFRQSQNVWDSIKQIQSPHIDGNLKEVEKAVGKVRLPPMPCRHEKIKGKLYACSDGIAFHGKRFFWESTMVSIPFSNLRQVQLQQDDGIRIITKAGDDYVFDGVPNVDQSWASLLTLQNEYLTKHAGKRSSLLRRTNSDPDIGTKTFHDLEEERARDEAETTDDGSELDSLSPDGDSSPTKMEDAWPESDSKESYSNFVVENLELSCSLDRFFDMFLRDGAECSIANFLEGRGDTELKEGSWADEAGGSKHRVIHYSHPVNAPLAPPRADARKEQSFKRYGDHGMILKTETVVDDVPMADCFFVADQIKVTRTQDERVSVSMAFEITFVKSTMFKGIISKTTASEFTAFFEDLSRYMSKALGEDVPEPTKATVPVAPAMSPPSPPFLYAVLSLLVAVLLGQVWIVREIRSLRLSVSALAQEQETLSNGIDAPSK